MNCWGANDAGQLGDSTTDDHQTPVRVVAVGGSGNLSTVTAVVAGSRHSCALLSGGQVACWGANFSGQLGVGTTDAHTTPVLVRDISGRGDLNDVRSLHVGADHTCALLTSGQVVCWGANGSGQLGDGTATNRSVPTLVSGPDGRPMAGVRALAAGGFHTCATGSTGNVLCWGSNLFGQLGDGTTVDRVVPTAVLDADGDGTFGGVRTLTAGSFHTCAILVSSRAACWGANFFGQLGDGSARDRTVATPVVPVGGGDGQLRAVRELIAAGNHTCSLLGTGTVACWGGNDNGQLGIDTTEPQQTPALVLTADANPLGGIRAIAAGSHHSCAMPTDGRLTCWGGNDRGQLGDGSRTERSTPGWVATTI